MDLLRELVKELNETAAGGTTSAGAVAGFRAPLFSGKRTKMQRRNVPTIFGSGAGRYGYYDVDYDFEGAGEGGGEEEEVSHKRTKRIRRRSNKHVFETYTSQFDSADVISKLRSAEQKAHNDQDVVGFALEDTEGGIIKVYVAADEAEPFERALAAELGHEDSNDDDDNTPLEIAEVLFSLKDRFTIVDVEWPDIEGDPEEEEDTVDAEGKGEDDSLENTDIESSETDGNEEVDAESDEMVADEEPVDDDGDVKSALASVIDLLKSQADAQKAQASASKAEAEAEEAKWNAQAAEMKLKQEEQVLDMEAYYDKQKDERQEAEKLKKLARWKHEVAQKAEDEMSESFNPFEGPIDHDGDRKMSPKDYIRYLFRHTKGQH